MVGAPTAPLGWHGQDFMFGFWIVLSKMARNSVREAEIKAVMANHKAQEKVIREHIPPPLPPNVHTGPRPNLGCGSSAHNRGSPCRISGLNRESTCAQAQPLHLHNVLAAQARVA